jgi:hypothetical protein
MPSRGVPVCPEDIPNQYSSRRELSRHPVGVNRHDASVTRLRQFGSRISDFVDAIKDADEARIEEAIVRMSESHVLFRPLAFAISAFVLLFDSLRLILTNWRLLLIQLLPALWIWLAMAILRAYVLYDQDLDEIYGLQIIPVFVLVIAITIASFFLNATFAFAIMRPGAPIRPAFAEARSHLGQIVSYGFVVGFLLGIATTVAPRWGSPGFSIFLGAVIGLMMVAYVAVPARIIGAKPTYSRRERMMTTVVSGVLGVTVSLPPYLLGRLGFLMLGSDVLRIPGIILVAIGVTLEAGATGAVRAIKLSAGLQQRSKPASREGAEA